MKELFNNKRDFNDEFSKWNIRNVTNMQRMFFETLFNGDISEWNVSSVTNTTCMFSNTPFIGDISGWNDGMSAM
jgi:hypothetical protein